MELTHDLPKWLNDLLPEPALPAVIKYSEGKYFVDYPEDVEYPESKRSELFDNIVAAYESVNIRVIDPIFDESLPELKDSDNDKGMVFAESELGPGFAAMLISSTEDDSLKILKYSYINWRNTAEEYLAHTDDFLMSYYFLDGHPCFWTRKLDNSGNPRDPFDWNTSGHAMNLWSSPSFSKKNSTGVSFEMEAGAHLAPNYTTHGRDFRMDVYGTSYEDAIIQTAARIHKFFDLEGNERENIDYEKSQLELELEARLERSTKALEETAKNKKAE